MRTWPEEAEGQLRSEFPAAEVGLSRASYALSHKDDYWSSPHLNTMTVPIANVPYGKPSGGANRCDLSPSTGGRRTEWCGHRR